MSDDRELASVRAIIEDDGRRLAMMRRNGVSAERIASFSGEIDSWKRRLKNLEAAKE